MHTISFIMGAGVSYVLFHIFNKKKIEELKQYIEFWKNNSHTWELRAEERLIHIEHLERDQRIHSSKD